MVLPPVHRGGIGSGGAVAKTVVFLPMFLLKFPSFNIKETQFLGGHMLIN